MKKTNGRFAIAIVWILVAILFFYMNKIGVGLCWLLVGITNLISAIKTHQMNNKIRAISKHLEETVHLESEEEESSVKDKSFTSYLGSFASRLAKCMGSNQYKTVTEMINLSKEEHIIKDESSAYEYVINKAFKPAKSHSAEVELLCTYAPDNEYGEEGNVPYIAVQNDDMVYCAVEEYKERKTFEGALSIEPLEGKFMFKAKREYYSYIMYFYGFEFEGEEYCDTAGLCLVYPKEYLGNEEEKKLMKILDEAAKSFHKVG